MPFSSHMCIEGYECTHTPGHTCKANQKFPGLSPPTFPLQSSALWHITQQHQLPDTSYQNRFGGLLIRPLKKSFLSMEGNVTPIPKAEERAVVLVEGSGVRAWQSELYNWPHNPLLDWLPDIFFPSRDVGKHPPHRQIEEAKYNFIMEGGRVIHCWTEMSEVENKMLKVIPENQLNIEWWEYHIHLS